MNPRARSLLRRFWPLLPLLALLIVVLLWDWNWFKPLLEKQASSAVGRTVTIDDLHVTPAWQTTVVLTRIRVTNPEGFTADAAPLASIGTLALRLGIKDLFQHRIRIDRLEIAQPVATLQANDKGLRNWQLKLPPNDPDATPWDVQIANLSIREGRYSLIDNVLKANLSGTVSTAAPDKNGESMITAQAQGHYRAEPFKLRFIGGSVLSLRTPENPYPVNLTADSGSTRVVLKGTLLDPLQFAGARLRLLLQGPNLATLADFTQLPLPNTPPYKLEGDLDYRARSILFKNFKGVMGDSDLAGDIRVRLRQPRPLLEATLRSKQVRLADLSGLVGGNPNTPAAAAVGGDGRLLPATPLNLPRLHTADVKMDFAGASIQGDQLPFDRLNFKLSIDDGVLRVSPADFGIGEGALRIYATLDPRGEQLGVEAKAELQKVNIARLLEKSSYKGSGRIGGTASLTGKGRSMAELLGGGDGELKLAMVGGDFSALLLDLAGLDFGNATLSLLGVTPRTEVRCLVGDFELKKGLLDTKTFVLDTGSTNLLLDGGANLKNESLNLRVRTQPKRPNIGRLKAPLHIKGSFANPRISPDYKVLGLRTASAVALGVLLTPLAAILPTLQLGPGEDRDCKALLGQAETTAPKQPRAR